MEHCTSNIHRRTCLTLLPQDHFLSKRIGMLGVRRLRIEKKSAIERLQTSMIVRQLGGPFCLNRKH